MIVRNLSFNLPVNQLQIFTGKLFSLTKGIFFRFVAGFKQRIGPRSDASATSFIDKLKPPFQRFPKLAKTLVLIVASVGLLIAFSKVAFRTQGVSDKPEVKSAKSESAVDREFSFPLKDAKGEKIAEIKYMIEKAELRDEIIVKGQKATAVRGRTFLIFNLKITNEYKSDIEIDSRDYIRLSVNGDRQVWLAPEIHNDPVQVQAISTKYTRVGFPINESDANLVLRVGEIDGEKEEIPLDISNQ